MRDDGRCGGLLAVAAAGAAAAAAVVGVRALAAAAVAAAATTAVAAAHAAAAVAAAAAPSCHVRVSAPPQATRASTLLVEHRDGGVRRADVGVVGVGAARDATDEEEPVEVPAAAARRRHLLLPAGVLPANRTVRLAVTVRTAGGANATDEAAVAVRSQPLEAKVAGGGARLTSAAPAPANLGELGPGRRADGDGDRLEVHGGRRHVLCAAVDAAIVEAGGRDCVDDCDLRLPENTLVAGAWYIFSLDVAKGQRRASAVVNVSATTAEVLDVSISSAYGDSAAASRTLRLGGRAEASAAVTSRVAHRRRRRRRRRSRRRHPRGARRVARRRVA